MLTSVKWINDYLSPPAAAEEQGDLLTRAGFPLEGSVSAGADDTQQDFEMTSNRGDCVCHVGLAREIAAISGRELCLPPCDAQPGSRPAADITTVTNHESKLCPLYTARIVLGVKVAPSPEWLADRLRAIGQIPRNNIVDATNFVLFELGQPAHVFDLNTLHGKKIIVRRAMKDEPFLPIGEGESEVKLDERDLVIADADRAVAIAGVKGGALTAVTDSTTDILIEAATFDPVSVRNSSRRLNISSDSSFRFERGVHPQQVDPAGERLAALIVEMASGELCAGVVSDGTTMPQQKTVSMRCSRCRQLLGVDISDQTMVEFLGRLEFDPVLNDDMIECHVPCFRLDIEREIDLIEEVSRMFGLDNIPIGETLQIRITEPQPTELAKRAVNDSLVGMGFVETVTHSLISEPMAQAFLSPEMSLLRVDEARGGAEPVLRPSLLPSLLRVRQLNHDRGVEQLKLFESASTFRREKDKHHEIVSLGLLADIENNSDGVRPMRGVVDRLIGILRGSKAVVEATPDNNTGWFTPGALLHTDGRTLGYMGVITPKIAKQFGLDQPLLAAELYLSEWFREYPPVTEARALPSFPAIDRDVSAIVVESTRWCEFESLIDGLNLAFHESTQFVVTYRGKQVGVNKKSVTLRIRFRALDRTLRNEEVDASMIEVVNILKSKLSAEIRS